MNTIKEVLRLKYVAKLSNREIGRVVGVSKSSISNYVKAYEQSDLDIDSVMLLSNEELASKLYQKSSKKIERAHCNNITTTHKPHPNWEYVHQELKKRGVTRLLLWQEYKQTHPNGYGYSQFKKYYAKYTQTLNPSMRQIHYAGDKLFVDFSGLTMPVVDSLGKEVAKAQIFVAVLGASGYTFVHAVSSQSTQDFIESHIAALHFFGGVPNMIVPDNLKAAVISNKKGVVKLNQSYADMARHYDVIIAPARVYKPQDKSKVELGVKGIQRWIVAKLRNHTFFSIDEINEALSPLIDEYNSKIIRKLNKSRTTLFESIDQEALHPLRANRYIYREFKIATVGVDYHIELDGHGYSVPYIYLGKKVEVAYSSLSVTLSYQGEIIASHPRLYRDYEDSTKTEHMPPSHQYQFEKWNPQRIRSWAKSIGTNTTKLIEKIMSNKSHIVRSYRSCMAILSLSKTYGKRALELACIKALEHNTTKVSSIEKILKLKTYQEPHQKPINNTTPLNSHENIRGKAYYQ